MRYSKENENVEVLKVTFTERQARQVRSILTSARYKDNTNTESRALESIFDEWLAG